jgi:hypothetical protein
LGKNRGAECSGTSEKPKRAIVGSSGMSRTRSQRSRLAKLKAYLAEAYDAEKRPKMVADARCAASVL